jgi:hypothetical protein
MPSPSITVRQHLATPRRPTPASWVEHLKNGGEPWGASAAARRSQPQNSGGTTATARLTGSERIWPVPHAPLSVAEVGLGPRGLGEGGRPQRALVPVPESHRGAGLEPGGAGLVRRRSR